jgi:site-specific DNA-methyltransferase (adenine-specific)
VNEKDKIQLFKGDCLEIMKDIPNGSIDMILCDLPYGTTQCKWDTIIPFDKLWEQYNRVIKDNGAIVLFGSEPFTSVLITSNIKNFKYNWIWKKDKATGHLNAKNSQ